MRAVFFDLDGTLVELPDDFAGLFAATLRKHGVGSDADESDSDGHRDHHDHRDYHEQFTEALFEYLDDCHPEPYRAAMADLRESADLDLSTESEVRGDLAPIPNALAETYTEHEARATALRPGAQETLDALDSGESDLALGVLTNGGPRCQHRKLAHHGIADYFDAVVVSGEVGARKPDPEIFAAAEDAIPADEYVFVADDLERDVVPAQGVGFTGVHLADTDPADRDGRADATVASLDAVPDVLG